MEIIPYNPYYHKRCIEIFKSNTPLYFGMDELEGLEIWLQGQDKGQLAYKNTVSEHFYMIKDNKDIAGCGGFYIKTDSPVANMVWGMVDNKFHGQGFGKNLLEYRIDQIKSNYPHHQIILDTTQHTYSFFEKLGFSLQKISKDFYDKGLDRYDMIYLAKAG